jgi:hypothetical protein
MKIVPLDERLRASASFGTLRRAWPEIVFHDAISNEYWGRLYSERPAFQFALVENGEVLAEGNSVPVSGLPASWREAFPNAFGGGTPDRLCALAILIDPNHQGEGLSRGCCSSTCADLRTSGAGSSSRRSARASSTATH